MTSPGLERGDRIWVVGSAQRRFWDSNGGRRSRLELIAHYMEVRKPDTEESNDPG